MAIERPLVHLVHTDCLERRNLIALLAIVDVSLIGWSAPDEFLNSDSAHLAQCLVLEIQNSEAHALATLALIKSNFPLLPVIVLAKNPSVQLALAVMREGIVDFLPEPVDGRQLRQCVTAAIQRSRRLIAHWSRLIEAEEKWKLLTPRERQVVAKIADGAEVAEIADDLEMSVRSAHKIRARAVEKLNARNRVELIKIGHLARLRNEAGELEDLVFSSRSAEANVK